MQEKQGFHTKAKLSATCSRDSGTVSGHENYKTLLCKQS